LLTAALEELRQQLIVEVRNNKALENEAKRLDKKIALLIKNRITLEVRCNLFFPQFAHSY